MEEEEPGSDPEGSRAVLPSGQSWMQSVCLYQLPAFSLTSGISGRPR